jgi:hypothetical protein
VRWSSFSVYGVKLHMLCATNGVPISYELTPANVAEVRLAEEPIAEADLREDLARRLLGDLAYRSEALGHALAECGISLVSARADQHGRRQRIERSPFRASSECSGWTGRWRRRWYLGSRPGSWRRSALTLTGFTSTGCWAGRRGASRNFGHENLATHI